MIAEVKVASPAGTKSGFALTLGTFAIYGAAYPSLSAAIGDNATLLATLPVVTAAWVLGVRAAVLTAIAALALNSTLVTLVSGKPWMGWMAEGGALGFWALIAMGAAVGLLRAWNSRSDDDFRFHEVDERRQAEDAVKESADKYRRLYDNTPVMMHSIDLQHRLISVNNYWLGTMGYEREEVIGRPITDFFTGRSRQLAEEVGIPTFFETGVVRDDEIQMVKKNGEVIDVLLSALADRDSEGRITSSMSFVVDVTERKRLEAQLLHSQKMEAVGTLAGGVAHDFNNMLTAITSYADLCAAKIGATEPVRTYLSGVQKAVDHASSLTRQLLTFSRHQIVEPRIIDPNDVVANVEKMLRRLIRENIELIVVPYSRLRRVAVDPGQMEQVLMNLVVNASEAMPDGGRLVIEAANVTLDAEDIVHFPGISPGEYAVIRVRDSGLGMTKEIQARIFEPFFTTKDVHRGTGLGLSTAYGIVVQSGGTITVESEPGEGLSSRYTCRQ